MQKLKEFRVKTGLSQCNIARKLDVPLSFYEKIERGHTEASKGFMKKLKKAFPEISIDEVFFSDIESRAV